VTSFQALLAPFLVDSFALQRRVLESPHAAEMLDGVEKAGVVGVALLPGPLRRPFALSGAFVAPEDYRGATIGIRPSGVARTTFRALKAVAKGFVSGSLTGLDGVEIDPKAITYNGYPGTLTANVVLWPKPYSIVMNRMAFEALTSGQREILRRAGREALAPELRQTVRDAAASLAEACRRGLLSLATASAADRTRLRETVRPVYEQLERDPETSEWIAAIEDMRGTEPATAAPLRCRASVRNPAAEATVLEGRWRLNWTRDELIAAGIPERTLPKGLPEKGSVTFEFANGRHRVTIAGAVLGKGTYSVEGDVVSVVYKAPPPSGLVAGQVYRQRWSVYRNRLTFARDPGSDANLLLLVNPLTRVRS
jgi:hypothetical protein